MRKFLDYSWKPDPICKYLRFNTSAEDRERQGYRCSLTNFGKCVGHRTLPIPYLSLDAEWDPCGLYATLRKSIVMRCPSREPLQSLDEEIQDEIITGEEE